MRTACVLVLVLSAIAGPAAAQTVADLASAEAAAAEARGLCPGEVHRITTLVGLRAGASETVQQFVDEDLVRLRAELAACVARPPPVVEDPDPYGALDDAPRGRWRPITRADDESGTGDFDVQAVIRMMSARRAAITRCYEVVLRYLPMIAGRVTVSMTVETDGHVTGVQVTDDETGVPAIGACVTRVVSGLRFSPGPAGGSVTYAFSFVFEPSG